MPKFDRRLLLGAVEQVLAVAPVQHEEREAKRRENWEAKRTQWLEIHGDSWREALTAIRAKLRKGQPVVAGDLPGMDRYNRSPYLFTDDEPKPREHVPDKDLVVLREVLTALVDDNVTTTGLRELGVSAHALRQAVSKLGNKRGDPYP